MNNLQQWGMELALLIRRRDAALAELADVDAKWDVAVKRISEEPSGTLYGSQTGEQPAVARNAVGWSVEPERAPEVAKPRNQAPVPMSRPLRTDHLDGGSTFALTPIADTVTMPAVVPCPRLSGDPLACLEQAAHLHQLDGAVKRLADL